MSKVADVPYETTILVRDCCLCLHVQRTARALARRFDEALAATRTDERAIFSADVFEPPRAARMAAVASLLAMTGQL